MQSNVIDMTTLIHKYYIPFKNLRLTQMPDNQVRLLGREHPLPVAVAGFVELGAQLRVVINPPLELRRRHLYRCFREIQDGQFTY